MREIRRPKPEILRNRAGRPPRSGLAWVRRDGTAAGDAELAPFRIRPSDFFRISVRDFDLRTWACSLKV